MLILHKNAYGVVRQCKRNHSVTNSIVNKHPVEVCRVCHLLPNKHLACELVCKIKVDVKNKHTLVLINSLAQRQTHPIKLSLNEPRG